MTADRRDLRARLAAALEQGDAIESRPLAEIRAALAEMGVDPSASVGLARKLARSHDDDPASRLLGRLERAEAVDAEIAALESADIAEIRAALPAGAATAATAAAARRSGRDAEAQRRRRRLPPLGWGGSLIGIAACLLIFVAIRPDRLQELEAPQASSERRQAASASDSAADALAPDSEEAAALAETAGPAEAGSGRSRDGQAGLPGAAAKVRRKADRGSTAVPAPPAPARLAPALPTTPATGREPARAEVEPRLEDHAEPHLSEAGEAATPPAARPFHPSTRPVPRPDDRSSLAEAAADDAGSARIARAERPSVPAEAVGLPSSAGEVVGVLIAADSAPAALRSLAAIMADERLSAGLDEARGLASGRKVLALVRLVREGREVEAAVVDQAAGAAAVRTFAARPPAAGLDALVESRSGSSSLSAPSIDDESDLELIELPAGG